MSYVQPARILRTGLVFLLGLALVSPLSPVLGAASPASAAVNCSGAEQIEAPPGDDYYNATYGSFYAGRSFVALGSFITEVGTWMHTASDQPLTFSLVEGSSIGGTVIASVTSDSAGGVGAVIAEFAEPVAVTVGNTYILKINSPTATTGITWNGDPTGSTGYYDGGSAGTTTTTAPAAMISFCDSVTEEGCTAGSSTREFARPPGDDYYNATYGSFYAGRSFAALGSLITEVGTWMYTASNQPLTFTLIEGSSIGGTVMASVTADSAGGAGEVTAKFDEPVAVTVGNTYILKINSPSATAGIVWNGDPTGSTGYYNGGSPGTTTTTAPAASITFCDVPATEVTFPPIDETFNDVHGNGIAGQSFVAVDGTLESATIWLTEANDGPLSISIRREDMSGRVLGSASLPAGPVGERTVVFESPVRLTPQATYVIAVTPAQLENQSGAVAQQEPTSAHQGYTEAGAVDIDMAISLSFGPAVGSSLIGVEECPPGPALEPAYVASVQAALTANTDIWGQDAIDSPDGPSLDDFEGLLNPLRTVGSPAGRSGNQLTDSGFYYLPFGNPGGTYDDPEALHVADGSQILTEQTIGRSLTVLVGADGTERYGLCSANLEEPTLHNGYQPVLDVDYTDLDGTSYSQQSFAAFLPGTESLASYVAITAEGSGTAAIAVTLSDNGLLASDGVVSTSAGAVLFYEEGALFSGKTLTYTLELTSGVPQTIYLVRPVLPTAGSTVQPDATLHDAARGTVTAGWDNKLAEGVVFDVPEQIVMDAQQNILIQNLALRWRYSVGNAYEAYYHPESSSALLTLANYGHSEAAASGAQFLLTGAERSYPAWTRGTKLQLAAQYFDITQDSAFIDLNTPQYVAIMDLMQADRATDPNGLMPKETEGGDIPDPIYGTHSQAAAWRGMVDILRVWRATGHGDIADEYQSEVDAYGVALKAAIASSSVQVSTDELFIPWDLLSGDQPYNKVTESHFASYWNLLNPYVLASGVLTETQLRQAWNYAANHGSTMIGLQRFNYYPTPIGSATPGGLPGYATDGDDSVYGVSRVKALAAMDEPDQLAVALYGKIAAGMTPNTFIAGEGHSIDPADGNYYRSMYLPPDVGNNDLFLVTLREMLVHVATDDATLAPTGLHLAYSTPRGWLEAGRQIGVTAAPTPFGEVTYSIESELLEGRVLVTADLPASTALTDLRLRLRLPDGYTVASAELSDTTSVTVNGETLELTGLSGPVEIEVRVDGPLTATTTSTTSGVDAQLAAHHSRSEAAGTVTFSLGDDVVCEAAMDLGEASCVGGAGLPEGTHTLRVQYSGGGGLTAAGTSVDLVVGPALWSPSTVYGAGATVTFAEETWSSLWWTQGQQPGDVNGPWQEIRSDDGLAVWTNTRIFYPGDVVTHAGSQFRAQWWTRNQTPGVPFGPWAPVN